VAIKLNRSALTNARNLVRNGDSVRDKRDDWSEHAPSTTEENDFIEENDYTRYAQWHLGVDDEKPRESKGRYSFPFGDFTKVHRCAVISLESRAAQNDHTDIATAAKNLLKLIDG
jgi:hypothetical protein